MARKLAVIGLGRYGVSIGMALQGEKCEFSAAGLDRNGDVIREVGKLKVFQSLTHKIPELLQDAGVIILTTPFDEVEITLKAISAHLKGDEVILIQTPVCKQVYAWGVEHLPVGSQLLTFTPIINSAHLLPMHSGMGAAAADLFKEGLFLVCGRENTSAQTTRTAGEVAEALGGSIFFCDPAEFDGLLAAYEILPGLISAAYFNSVIGEGGWHYGRKLTGGGFGELTRPLAEPLEREDFGASALVNSENSIRVLDTVIRELHTIRDALQKSDPKKLAETLGSAFLSYPDWWSARQNGRWEPTARESLGRDEGFLTGVMGLPSVKKK